MKTLVVNCGIASLRYELFDMKDETVLAKGYADRIGTERATLRHDAFGRGKITVRAACEWIGGDVWGDCGYIGELNQFQ